MHGKNVLLIILFTVLLFVDEDLGSRSSAEPVASASKSCEVVADVVVVFEIPAGRKEVAVEIRNFFRQFRAALNPSLSCIRLSFILSWKEVNTIVQLNCNYNQRARCVISADNSLTGLGHRFPKSSEFDKNNLVKAIASANTLLFSPKLGARSGVKKVCLLVLTAGPKENVMPTQDAVKDLHDQGVVVITLGIGEGRKENIDEIVVFPHYAVFAASIRALSSTHIIKQLKSLVIRPYGEFSKTRQADVSAFALPLMSLPEPTELPNIVAADLKEQCKYIVDIGFLVDSSGSLRKYYGKEKFFVRRIATSFNISEAGSHGGLIIFSAKNYVKTVIKFDQYKTLETFNTAVENIPYYGYLTRIDLALDKAHGELFTLKDRARPNVKKVAFLITDGMQNPDIEANGNRIDPAAHAAPLHNRGINLFAVGIGERINLTELALITRSKDRVFTVKNFDELISHDFVKNVSQKLCKEALKPEKNETTGVATTTSRPTAQIRNTTAAPPIPPTVNPCQKSCSSCGCGGGCCDQKPDVYINVFSGNNNKNSVSQGMKVTQSGNRDAESKVNFPTSNDSDGPLKQNTKDMSSNDIATVIKECLPFQKKMNEGIQELLRRSLKTHTNNPNMQINKKRRK